jgi:hypothetical protein
VFGLRKKKKKKKKKGEKEKKKKKKKKKEEEEKKKKKPLCLRSFENSLFIYLPTRRHILISTAMANSSLALFLFPIYK